MTIFLRRRFLFALAAIVIAVVAILSIITSQGQATPSRAEGVSDSARTPDWDKTDALNAAASIHGESVNPFALPVPPTQDPCLHCHILGENTNLWMPLSRWLVFGAAALVFGFGVFRTLSVVNTKKRWKPLTARTAEWVDERYEISEPLSKILNKPVPRFATRWWYCLGGITAFLFVIQGITGIMLAFYYKPTPEAAYASIQFIETEVRFGSAIRMIHHWSANFMVVVCIAHMLRVFIMGAFKPPRELNWVSGVILLLVTLGFGLTGYLLPWDQRAFWATTVATEIAGSIPVIGDLALVFMRVGWDVADLTLSRFYSAHIMVLPLITVGFMVAHFLMVRRQGIKEPL